MTMHSPAYERTQCRQLLMLRKWHGVGPDDGSDVGGREHAIEQHADVIAHHIADGRKQIRARWIARHVRVTLIALKLRPIRRPFRAPHAHALHSNECDEVPGVLSGPLEAVEVELGRQRAKSVQRMGDPTARRMQHGFGAASAAMPTRGHPRRHHRER